MKEFEIKYQTGSGCEIALVEAGEVCLDNGNLFFLVSKETVAGFAKDSWNSFRQLPPENEDSGEGWRFLQSGETIQSGDEYFSSERNWYPVSGNTIGKKISKSASLAELCRRRFPPASAEPASPRIAQG